MAIIAGILFATFLTLVLVPVMYSLVDDFEDFFRRHFSRRPGAPTQTEESESVSPEPRPDRAYHPGPEIEEPEPVGARRQRTGRRMLEPLPETS